MDPMLIAAGAQAAAGVAQAVSGMFQNAKAKKIAAKNPRPKYYIPKAVKDNQSLIESKAGQGMSDAARNTFIQEQERGLTAGIEAILKGGGSVNNIADIYGNYSSGVARMSIIDDEMRAANIRNMIAQNNEMASFKDKEWQINVFAPYADKAQAAAALKKQGSDNLWKGINTVTSAAANYATSEMYQNESDRVFGEQKRVNDAYIENLGRPTPAPVQNNTNIIPIQQGQQFFPPNATNFGGQYNWMMPNFDQPAPVMPQPVEQPTVYETIQAKYPGLMYSNNFFLKR